MKKFSWIVTWDESKERLDAFVALKSGLTRSQIQKDITLGLIAVNSHPEKANYKVKRGDTVELTLPEEPDGLLVPEDIPLDVLWEDEHIIVVNKPPRMVVHPALGNRSGTLMNALLARCGKLASAGTPLRPGVVHRLDKDTSGVIVIAKTDQAYYGLHSQFKERETEKYYVALVYGRLKTEHGEINKAIGRSVSDRKRMSTKTRRGKEAVTKYSVMKRFAPATLVKIKILTGRTHQIRVHFSSIGHPVLGDRTYGKKVELDNAVSKKILFPRQMLHAYSLKLRHPVSGEIMEFTAPIPEDMERAVESLENY